MRRWLALSALALALALGAALGWAAGPAQGPDAGCRGCHPDMAPAMPPAGKGHALACVACHQGDGAATDIQAGHAGLAANPAALDQAPRACGPCHPGWPQRVRRSPMATNAGLINQTRYLLGAQDSLEPRFGVRAEGGLAAIPEPAASGQAVDDFLRRRCLRCHLWSPGADLDGARRSAGCAACHRPRDGAGRPAAGHGLTRRVPTSQCLTCHGGGCGAGAAFVGRVARDDDPAARFLEPDPDRPSLIQARAWRPMRPDLHHRAGLACIDCHTQAEIMGDGRIRAAGLLHVGVRCASCHGEPGRPAREARTAHGERLAHVLAGNEGLVVWGKLDGKLRPAPGLRGGPAQPVAHQVAEHARVACHACHAGLNPADWGTMVQLETRPAHDQWLPMAAQGDPQVLAALGGQAALSPDQRRPPASRDYLSGQERPGLWLMAPWFRRFEWRVYGQGPDGRTFLLAPRFQYVVTRLDQEGRLVERAAVPRTAGGLPGLGLTPWNPHATQRPTPGCAGCHGNARALGLGLTFAREGKDGKAGNARPKLAPGLWRPRGEGLALDHDWLAALDPAGRPLQVFLVPGSRPYPAALLDQLLRPGKAYTRWLLPALEQEWPGPADEPRGR
ncbi:MAG: hypothetical protein ACOZHQ_07275 [Thermodesulfobacteriota bacterium]